ncbi:MAG: hypothetical protein IID32_08315 [Planctomycetes bacterium]|nr:hypothetical protein [Planctomycetota bacterium]
MAQQVEISKGLIQRWREGEWSRSSTASTLVLAFCLAATLLSAFALVLDRSGMRVARQNGREMIQQVRQRGLEKYLGHAPLVMYYLLKEDNQARGYGALYLHRNLKGGQVVYQGRELFRYPSLKREVRTVFTVTNDLAEYDYSKEIQNIQTGLSVELSKHSYREGVLKGLFFDGRRGIPILPIQPMGENFVPVFLLDFFSSLSAKNFPKKGAAFSFALLERIRYNQPPFQECWVQAGGEIPSRISENQSRGHGVTVNWNPNGQPSDLQSRGLISQTIYYDMNHQLIWQKSVTENSVSIQKAITPEELDRLFPGSKQILEDWLGEIQGDEENRII